MSFRPSGEDHNGKSDFADWGFRPPLRYQGSRLKLRLKRQKPTPGAADTRREAKQS